MHFTPLAFIELFVVLAFAVGWIVLELVARRLDGRREDKSQTDNESSDGSNPPAAR